MSSDSEINRPASLLAWLQASSEAHPGASEDGVEPASWFASMPADRRAEVLALAGLLGPQEVPEGVLDELARIFRELAELDPGWAALWASFEESLDDPDPPAD